MLAQQIKIRGEPTSDPQKCRFVLDGEVLSRASISFTRDSDMEKAPLAKQLLDLSYIAQVNIAGQVVTLTGDNVESWPSLGKEIGEVIRSQLESGEAPVTEEVNEIVDITNNSKGYYTQPLPQQSTGGSCGCGGGGCGCGGNNSSKDQSSRGCGCK